MKTKVIWGVIVVLVAVIIALVIIWQKTDSTLTQTKSQLDQIKSQLDQTKSELDETKSQLDQTTSQLGQTILFSLQVNPDYSPISPTTTFRPNTKRIYACFKNEGVLANLYKVIAKWTNQTNKNIIDWQTFPLTPDAKYNHVWVKLDNWDVGKYLVSIYKQSWDVEPVACGEFEIK